MEPVLLLNASFEPLRVINWKRALTLVFAGKVEVVEEYTREIHSISLAVRLPAVVRLLTLIRVRGTGVKFSRQNIYARDNYECQYCGCQPSVSELTYDHIVPRAHGGPTDWTNIVTCCITCNRRKGEIARTVWDAFAPPAEETDLATLYHHGRRHAQPAGKLAWVSGLA